MKKAYRVYLVNANNGPCEIKQSETAEIIGINQSMNLYIEAKSIREAQDAALAYGIKIAPDIPWKITCAEETTPCRERPHIWE